MTPIIKGRVQDFLPDLACLGMGINGHPAFNEPHISRFEDPEPLRLISPQPASREKQVLDGCFANLKQIPHQGLNLTIPAIL